MPLFVCDQCNYIDNTACGGNFWTRHGHASSEVILCCECNTGKWHDRFPKRHFDPATEDPETIKHMAQFGYIPARHRWQNDKLTHGGPTK